MKPITFDPKTFDGQKPAEVKGAKLSSALKEAQKALADEKKKKDDASAMESCLNAIQSAAKAASETIKKECDAKKHKDLVTALKKFDTTCKSEVKRLEDAIKKAGSAAGDDEDGEVNDDELFGPKLFKECIKKAKLKSSTEDGVSFCFAVHKKAEDCKLVLMKKKKFFTQVFKRVYKIAKEKPEMGLKRPKMTYGAGYRDAEERDTLVLHIADGAPTEIAGMARKLEKWRKRYKQELLPFKNLTMRMPNGQPLEMTPDPDEEEETATSGEGAQQEAGQQEQENAPAATQTAQGGGQAQTQQATETPGENQTADTQAVGPVDENAIENKRKEFKKARRAWQTVKEKAIQDLEAVKDGIRDYYLDDPEQFKVATGKLGQLDAIMDNLNDDLRDVLDKYVSTPKSRQAELERLGDEATSIVDRFLKYASQDKLLNAVDQKEFAEVEVKKPIEKALKDLVKTLA